MDNYLDKANESKIYCQKCGTYIGDFGKCSCCQLGVDENGECDCDRDE